MKPGRTMSAQLAFPLAAFISGFASGMSYFVPGSVVILPGLLFGIAIAIAVHHTVEALEPSMVVVLIVLSVFGFWIAVIAALLSIRFSGGGNNLFSGSIAGMFAGGAWASVTAVGLAISCEHFQSIRVFTMTTLAGAVCGILCTGVVYLHDNAHVPHPLDFILVLLIWQVGVASVMPMSRKVRTSWPP